MGRSTDAILVYGYDLGGADGGWKIKGLGKYGELPTLDWYDEENDDDFPAAVEKRLMAEVGGFTEEWAPGAGDNGYFDRRAQAEKKVGVKLKTYCSLSAPAYALAAHVTTVARGEVDYIDPRDLAERPFLMDWDSRLVVALDALDLAPLQEHPRWFLVSYGEL